MAKTSRATNKQKAATKSKLATLTYSTVIEPGVLYQVLFERENGDGYLPVDATLFNTEQAAHDAAKQHPCTEPIYKVVKLVVATDAASYIRSIKVANALSKLSDEEQVLLGLQLDKHFTVTR